MSSDDWEDPAELTFADVLNGFTFSGGRGRRGEPDPGWHHRDEVRRHAEDSAEQYADPAEQDESASIVRAYAWTGGRTRSEVPLQIETLVQTSELGLTMADPMQAEYRSIADLCRVTHSVAEVAALLAIPLGVSKVLVGDMAGLGLVVIYADGATEDTAPTMDLMERVLSGLRSL
jgi:Protein of unknown function (DUF742)